MACYSCSTKFSLLKKEKNCGNCKLSFCSNCLDYKYTIDGNLKMVCADCYNKLMFKCPSKHESDVPALLLKRLESMENPNQPPVTVFKSGSKLERLKTGLSDQDKLLVERLEKLKEDNKKSVVPSDEEIRRRLNALQGKSNDNEKSRPHCSNLPDLPAKTKSEQVDDLLKKYMDEVALEDPMNDSDDEEAAANFVMDRAIAEAALPPAGGSSVSNDEPMEEELPWCELCNEDATLRCITCENALYCNRCLKESHDSFDLKEHKFVPYKK